MRLAMSFMSMGPWEDGPRRLELPMAVDLPSAGRFEVVEQRHGPVLRSDGWGPEAPPSLKILGETEVDPRGMELKDDQIFMSYDAAGKIVPAQAIDCPEIDLLTEGAVCVGGAIGFALGVPLETMPFFSPEDPNHFIAESEDDHRILADLGTERAQPPLAGTGEVEVFRRKFVDAAFVEALAKREIPSIYQGALGSQEPAVRFRALWRVLEFSFQAHGQKLVDLLTEFPPTRELGFDRRELEDLRTLRGRLSHAASRTGLREWRQANEEAIDSLGRLWSLVDWVTLCKREPGRSLDVEKLESLAAYIDRDGKAQVPEGGDDARDRMRNWSEGSPRFRPPTAFW
jgi:hypothetical protein